MFFTGTEPEYSACTLQETAEKLIFFKSGVILPYKEKTICWSYCEEKENLMLIKKCKTIKAYVYRHIYKYTGIRISLGTKQSWICFGFTVSAQ